MAIQRIGILTSGGDCAGLNPAIRAVVHRAVLGYGWQVIGIRNGTAGLLARPVEWVALTPSETDIELLRRGGTILGSTNKGDPFAYPMPDGRVIDRSNEVIEGYRQLRLDALIVAGGDGSLHILRKLAQQGGIPLVAIPKTIDNDLGLTEVSIGHATALSTATDALDHLQPTAASHSRVMVLEVMGRDAGHIALSAGIAGGADVILIPEIPYSFASIAAQIEALKAGGRNFALVIVAEAVKRDPNDLAGRIRRHPGQHRPLHRRAHRRADRRRDPGHRAGPYPARRHAQCPRPHHGLGLRRARRRPDRRRGGSTAWWPGAPATLRMSRSWKRSATTRPSIRMARSPIPHGGWASAWASGPKRAGGA